MNAVRRLLRPLRAHPVLSSAIGVALVAVGGYVAWQVGDLVDPEYAEVTFAAPTAPKLNPESGETIYRIDPTRSEARYEIGEKIFGADASTAVGRTNGIAGDFAINGDTPSKSRVGEIVINLEQLTSDSSLRDARIRSDYLESHQFKLARFTTTELAGLPDSIAEGRDYDVDIIGDLTVKSTTRRVTWTATARRSGDELEVDATTTIKLSEFGMAPISIVGLVSTDDDVKLGLKVTAVDPSEAEVPTEIPDLTKVASTTKSPSYSKEVEPILEQNCASCHNSGTIGADVLRLDNAGDASTYASGIALVTRTGYMPPWPASDVGVPLEHPRELDESSLKILADWAAGGGKLDVKRSTALDAPAPDPSQGIRSDAVLTMDEPYVGDGTKTNDYRCVIFDPGFTEPTYVTGYSFVPGTLEVVHHGLVYRVDAADRDATLAKSGVDGRTGWECNLGGGVAGSTGRAANGGGGPNRGALFAGWVPGQRPIHYDADQGFLFNPGELIVAQIHYHYGDKVLADSSKLVLQTEAPNPAMRELVVNNPVGPVELPCPADRADGPLCNRDAALDNLTKLYGAGTSLLPNALNRLCGPTATTSDPVTGNGTTTCDRKVGRDGSVVDVLGHMHTMGKSFRMTLNPGTPGETVLLDIPVWNFDWQLNYQPVDPVPVKRGDTIRIECSWDRSLRYDPEPRYLVFAEGTEDEMCFSTYTVLPNQP